jgi:DNA polymerase I-like protein with 3'-5' exonuclease and polymerase domains
LRWLETKKLTAFNVAFDGRLVLRDTGKWAQWVTCTYGLFRQLSQDRDSEEFRWNLESLEEEVLGWPESHKQRLIDLLKEHGLSKSSMGELAWKEPEEFAYYGALDAEAAWQAHCYFRKVLRENIDTWGKTLAQFHTNEFLTQCRYLAEQNLRGMAIDRPRLLAFKEQSEKALTKIRKELLEIPEIQPWLEERRHEEAKLLVGQEPPKFKKDGVVTKRWEQWEARTKTVCTKEDAVNWNSKDHLADLFFRFLGFKPERLSQKTKRPVVDKFALQQLGPIGQRLLDHNKLVKMLGYVNSLWELSASGIFHGDYNSHGTITGRPAAGEGGQ